jgi:CheY-like chemotaxis protein
MSLESGYGKLSTPEGTEPGEVKVLLTESDDRTRAAAEVVLEDLGVAVISARSAARALDLCNAAHLRFEVLVVGPSQLDGGLESFLGRVLSVQKTLRVLALTAGNRHHAGGPTMTPLGVCWSLERLGCEYSLLDAPWTGPRLHQCLQELLARPYAPVAFEHVAKGSEDDRFPVGTQRPSPVRTRLKL